MKIAIVGGGNLGSLMAAELSMVENTEVTLLTRNPQKFSECLKVLDIENDFEYISKTIRITDEYELALSAADIIFCTLPSFLILDFATKAEPYLSTGCLLGFVPGSGGVEFACCDIVKKGITVFGMQRVPFICRMSEYGKTCINYSKRDALFIGTIPSNEAKHVCSIVESLLGIKSIPLMNYLAVTFTPSNPILHTSRLYDLFADYQSGMVYECNPLFYRDWTNRASEVLLACDSEVQELCKKIPNMDLTEVKSLTEHYESKTAEALTNKLRSIAALSKIKTPMIESTKGSIPDLDSRYFTEDFPYGLVILKGFSQLVDHDTPTIDMLLAWYRQLSGKVYFTPNGQTGNDILFSGAPQRFGFTSIDEVMKVYNVQTLS